MTCTTSGPVEVATMPYEVKVIAKRLGKFKRNRTIAQATINIPVYATGNDQHDEQRAYVDITVADVNTHLADALENLAKELRDA